MFASHTTHHRLPLLPITALLLAFGGFCAAQQDAGAAPPGLDNVKHPDDNPASAAKIALGHQLYFEQRLSRENDISCASCHDPQKGWSNGEPFATGFQGQKGGRNSPTIINTAFNRFHFWDGRSGSLEDQALGPIQNPIEMNLTLEEAVTRLNAIDGYRRQFNDVFGTDATADAIGKAIAAFERTILCGDAPYDRFKAGDQQALSDSAQRGMKIFFGKGVCSACHVGHNFTDNAFHNIGVGMDRDEPDVGREALSGLKGDRGSFKTPTLRDIAKSGPYMHDGSLKTLDEVIEHYDRGGIQNPWLDEEIFPLKLTAEEKADLLMFLTEGLGSNHYPDVKAPKLP